MGDSGSSTKQWAGAGILPYARANNNTNDIYLLLGKEDVILNWKFGSNKWCDFSGGKEDNDMSIEDTAAREFYEESLAVSTLWDSQNYGFGNWKQFSEMLRNGRYAFRFDRLHNSQNLQKLDNNNNDLVVPLQSSMSSTQTQQLQQIQLKPKSTRTHKTHSCFLVEVPFYPTITKEFDKTRNRLLKLRKCARIWHDVKQKFIYPDLIPGYLPDSTVPNLSKESESDHVGSLANISIINNNVLLLRYINNGNGQICDIKKPLIEYPEKNHQSIIQFVKSWSNLLGEFRNLPYTLRKHPAIVISRIPQTTYIYNIQVLECYMEKQKIGWWSLPWLKESLQHGGAFRMELFRGAFMPLLSVVIDLFYGASPGKFVIDVRPWSSSSTFGIHSKYLLKNSEETDLTSSNSDQNINECQDDEETIIN